MRILLKFFREQYNIPFKEHLKSILYGATLFIQEGNSIYTIHFSYDTQYYCMYWQYILAA